MRRIFLASMLLLISGAAHAAGPAAPQPSAQPQATRIETEQKTGAILFIVKGHEEARIDAKGLHVRDGIDYAGVSTDIGTPADYDRQFAAEPKH
jgi:hypothetical protein